MARYLNIPLFNGTTAPTRNDVDSVGVMYLEYTQTQGVTQVGRKGLGTPYNINISNRFCVSRIKVCYIYDTNVTGSVIPIYFALKGGNASQFPAVIKLQYINQSPSSSTTSTSINTNSGVVDSRSGLPIYYSIATGEASGLYTNQVLIPTSDTYIASDLQNAIDSVNDGIWDYIISEDPYSEDGFTDKEGGTGDFDNTSDIIGLPPLPTISVSDTGFVNIYNPTLTQLQNLATFMWTNPLFDLSQWRALFANPMQAILSLAILPVAIPNGGTRTIKVGNISTDISMTVAAQQFIEFDCGSLNINEHWGSYLDYSPFTRLSIFLPFVGYRDLNIDECMGKTLQVNYYIDIFTGACSAFIRSNGSVLYNFSGNCAFNVPISGTDFSNVVNGILSAVGTGITALATGGESAAFGAVASMSADVMNAKPHVQKGGSMGGNAGFLGHRTPYLILIRPRQAVPQNQNEFLGYPSFITADLANVTGYTEVINIFLQNGFTATENELNEIKRLLSEGVIL